MIITVCSLFVIVADLVEPITRIIFLGFAAVSIVLSVLIIFTIKMQYIVIDGTHIKSRYRWIGKIDCDISDVEYVSWGNDTLTIKLKNGKRHMLFGLVNSIILCNYIRRQMNHETKNNVPELKEKLAKSKGTWKKEIIIVLVLTVIMFANIFIAVLLTGARDIGEFKEVDRLVMIIMGVVELSTIILTFFFANKAGKRRLDVEIKGFYIQKAVIETFKSIPGNIKKSIQMKAI